MTSPTDRDATAGTRPDPSGADHAQGTPGADAAADDPAPTDGAPAQGPGGDAHATGDSTTPHDGPQDSTATGSTTSRAAGRSAGSDRDRSTASALRLVGVIVAMAVVVAAATIVWARVTGQAAPQVADARDRPTTLQDGRRPPAAPAALTHATGLPVLMTARIDPTDPAVARCELDPGVVGGAFVTPEHAVAQARMDEPPPEAELQAGRGNQPVNVACVQHWDDGGWQRTALAAGPTRGDDARFPLWMCCDQRGNPLRFHVLDVVPEAAWLLQDRGTYAIGYDVGGLDTAGVTTIEDNVGRGTSEHLWWVDEGGAIVGEVYAGG